MDNKTPSIETKSIKHSSSEWDIDNLPNRITLLRIILTPIIIAALAFNLFDNSSISKYSRFFGYLAAWTFVVAAITDFIDGYFARTRGLTTVFGSFLDPIADKFLTISSLIMLQALNRIPVIIVLILVLREMYITSLRLLASEKGLNIPVGIMGKWKTAMIMIGIPLLMAYDKPWKIPMPIIGKIFIYIAVFLSIYSAIEYSIGIVKKFKKERDKAKTKLSIKNIFNEMK